MTHYDLTNVPVATEGGVGELVPGGFTRRQAHLNRVRVRLGERGHDYDLGTFDRAYQWRLRFADSDLRTEGDWIVFAAALEQTIGCCDEVECDPGRSAVAAVVAARNLGLVVPS